MNTKTLMLCIVAAALVVQAKADTVITDNPSKISVAASTTFSASTAKQTDYPSGLPTPIFWFDARQTNGWVFSGSTVTNYIGGIAGNIGQNTVILIEEGIFNSCFFMQLIHKRLIFHHDVLLALVDLISEKTSEGYDISGLVIP